jgi:2-C-methyl-D-erythritol 4-phosphate cytidylyltransferase
MVSAIIVAAGKGTRMGPSIDKLFLPVADRPLVAHTWRAFDRASCVDEIILVIRDGLQSDFEELGRTHKYFKSFKLVTGGAERQDSVWNGLQALSPESEIVLIQDGARPCTRLELIQRTIQAARESGAAVAAQKVTDTIKESGDGTFVRRNVDRSRLWAVQTPQTFRVSVIRAALKSVRDQGLSVTDDTAACELIGQQVRLVPSPSPNPKATAPSDIPYIDMLLREISSNDSI